MLKRRYLQTQPKQGRVMSCRIAPRRDDRPSRAPDLGTSRSSLATLTTTPKPKPNRGFTIDTGKHHNHKPRSRYTQQLASGSLVDLFQEKEGCSTGNYSCNVPPPHPPLRRRARAAQNRRAERAHVPLSVRDASVGGMERYCVFGAFGSFISTLLCYLYPPRASALCHHALQTAAQTLSATPFNIP